MGEFVSKPVDLGHGYRVEFSFRPDGLLCEWAPDLPDRKTPRIVLKRYENARNAFVVARLLRLDCEIGPAKAEQHG